MSESRPMAFTKVIELSESFDFSHLTHARIMSKTDFIDKHGSGTLRKNQRLGFAVRSQYLEERTAFDFGWGFECIPVSRVRWGDPISEGDCKSVTEAGWFADRYIERVRYPGDVIEVKSIEVEYPDQSKREGIGLVVRETTAPWVPKGYIIFAIISEWDVKNNCYLPAQNPC